jgi:hypothetical protein
MSTAFCADARGVQSSKAKTRTAPARGITLRSVLVWGLPLLAFAWLAVAARGASGRPALPAGGALLGGGAVAHHFVPLANYKLHFTTVSLANDGQRVKFYGDWNGRCQGFPGAVTASFFEEVRIHGDGSFDGSGPLESTSAEGTFRFKGLFKSPGSASGTGSVRFTFHNGTSSYACDTGTVGWQVRTALGRFGRPRPLGGKAYFGNTTQRLPMVLRVSPDGRTVDQQALMWNAKCKDNVAGLGRATSSPAMRIRADGTFGWTERYTENYGGFVAHITSRHTGRFGLSTASGTWRVHVDVRNAQTKKRADSCDSGPMRWAVRV